LILDGVNFYRFSPPVAYLRDQYPIIFERIFLPVGKITDRGHIYKGIKITGWSDIGSKLYQFYMRMERKAVVSQVTYLFLAM
jgi:hypothetical protein